MGGVQFDLDIRQLSHALSVRMGALIVKKPIPNKPFCWEYLVRPADLRH